MPNVRRLAGGCGLVLLMAAAAAAQPTISSSSTLVTPGETVTITVNGPAGEHYAVIASAVGAGFSYGGVALAVGPDVQIISTGVIGGTGSVAVGFTPPFLGTALDRYYVQAVTATNASFVPPVPSAGLILRNAEALAPSGQKGSNDSRVDVTLVLGNNYVYSVPPFVVERTGTCFVTTEVQVSQTVGAAVPIGSTITYLRLATERDGVDSQDGVYGQYIVSTGLTTLQMQASRTSVVPVTAGETIRFGAFLGSVANNAVGKTATVHTAYHCS